MRATAVGRHRRPGTRCGVRPLSTAGAYRDIGRVLLRCLDGIRDNDEAALRGAFARDATVTHTCPEQHMSFTAGVDELVRRVHRLHDEYACAAESPVRISIGVDGSAAVARVEFVLLIGEAAFGGVGFYTLRAGPEGWEITRRLCLL